MTTFSKQVKVTRHASHFSNNPSCFYTYHLDQEYTTVPDHFACTPPLLYSCSTPGVFSNTWRTLASFCFLTLQNLLVPNGVANVISPDCSLLNKKHRTKCTKLTELHTKAFQVSCTDVCIAVPAKLYGFWVLSFYFSHEFSFQILYILYFWQIQCGMSFVRSGDERKKRKVY